MKTLDDVFGMLQGHSEQDDTRFGAIQLSLDSIKDNHLAHIAADVQATKTDVEWLKTIFWVIATPIVGLLIALFFKK